jgi:hypothetical protein
MFLRITLLFGVCCLTLLVQAVDVAAAPRSDDLQRTVDRYIKWRGGVAYERLQSIHQRSVLETAGLKGTEEVWADRRGRVRVMDDTGVLKQSEVISPEMSWDTTPSGQLETLSISDRHSIGRLQALQFADALRGQGDSTASTLGLEKRDGRTWAVVRIRFGDDDHYDAFIDPATGALLGFRIVEDRQQRFEGFADWHIVRGVRMPFLHTTKTDSPSDDETMQTTAITLNESFLPSLFVRPTVGRKALFKDGASSTGWIPFEFWAGNRIYFPAKVNGHEVNVLLDSGASVSSIDKAYAASIGLVSKGNFAGAGSGGVETFGFINGVQVQVGNLTLRDINVGAFDFTQIAEKIGHPLLFVLGDELFNELAVEIDFKGRRLLFRDPATVVKPAGAVEVPLVRVKDRTVPVSVEHRPAVQFEFDLGDGSAIDIFPSYYKAQKLLENRRTSQRIGGGVGGFSPETVATLSSIDFAGVAFAQVPANFTNDTRSADNSNLILGVVGVPVLERFQLIVDYSHDRLFATPYPEIEAPFGKDRLGIHGINKDDAIVVDFVSPGSPAQAAGLKIGDKISAINQSPTIVWNEAKLRELRNQNAGTVVTLTLSGGGIRKVILADFY